MLRTGVGRGWRGSHRGRCECARKGQGGDGREHRQGTQGTQHESSQSVSSCITHCLKKHLGVYPRAEWARNVLTPAIAGGRWTRPSSQRTTLTRNSSSARRSVGGARLSGLGRIGSGGWRILAGAQMWICTIVQRVCTASSTSGKAIRYHLIRGTAARHRQPGRQHVVSRARQAISRTCPSSLSPRLAGLCVRG